MDQQSKRPFRRPIGDGALPVRDPLEALTKPELASQRTAGAAMLGGVLVLVIAVMSLVDAVRHDRFPWPELLAIAAVIGAAVAGWIAWRRRAGRR
ncbi:MAG: hypothetical protein U0Q03_15025 [Acidimicrobiales bacterium]